MRVLVVSNQYSPVIGGIEVLLRQLVPALVARGHEIEVLTSTHQLAPDARTEVDGITVHRLDVFRSLVQRDPAGIARGRKAAAAVRRAFAPDLVHAHDLGPNLWALDADRHRVPVLTTLHLGLATIEPAQRGPMARMLVRSDWVTGVSAAVVEEAVALEPSIADRCSVIINGLPPSPEPGPPEPGSRRIVAVGRLAVQKGFDVLLRAMPRVLEQQPDAELVLVGDGPVRPELESLVVDLGLGSAVTLTGAVRHDDVAGLLASAAVVAIPSRFEGMPLVALEAAAAGRAVVSTPVHGLADVVVDGATGVIVPPEDPERLAAGLVALLADPPRAAALGAAARRRCVDRFSLDHTADEYDERFHALVRASRGATSLRYDPSA